MTRPKAFGIVLLLSVGCCANALSADSRVRAAASGVYIHGMTAAIADREVGRGGIRELLGLLDDPSFPRRDNVVAFLAYLGGPESTKALVRMLDPPAPPDASTEDERALLLAPHALGRIAARGDRGALDALLAITAQRAAVDAPEPSVALREASIAGLALTGAPEARERLAAIADGRIVPDPEHPELASRARSALDSIVAPAPDPAAAETFAPASTADPAHQTHAHGLTFVNHANVASPMTSSRLDAVLEEGSERVASGDSGLDVACCAVVSRSGSGGTFGTNGDGHDTIDDSATLTTVLSQSAGRVKIVKVINYCGGPGTNIIGCSYSPGSSIALVRLTSLAYEAVLWVHEYGHNLGLGHSTDPGAIMFGTDNGANNRLALAECSAFHTPAPSANAVLTVAGTCTNDGDSLADPIDNCPLVANDNQADADADGIGDACETGPPIADIDDSGRVDGLDLAILGRAFGAALGSPRYVAAADLDQDGQVDGADLALLARDFGK